MKYYTKEWVRLVYQADFTISIEPIENKEYTDEDINELYNSKLEQYLEEEEQNFNELPILPDLSELLDNFDPKDWAFIDEATGKTVRPNNKEEVVLALKKDSDRIIEEYEARGEFDREKAIKEFADLYNGAYKSITEFESYPKYIMDNVDARLIALGLMPEYYYNMLEDNSNDAKEKLEEIEEKARLDLETEDIPENIKNNFFFHDSKVLQFKRDNDDFILILDDCGMIVTLTFNNADLIENENIIASDIYKYDEIYKTEFGYEIHMMFYDGTFKYLTISCSDIDIKQ